MIRTLCDTKGKTLTDYVSHVTDLVDLVTVPTVTTSV